MAEYIVRGADGKRYKITAPNNLSEYEIKMYAQSQLGSIGVQEEEEDDGPGFTGALGNAFARMGGRARGLIDAYQAEQFSTVADGQEKQAQIDAERAETGEQPSLLEKIATYRFPWAQPLESTDELRGLAAENIQQQAVRNQEFALKYPMSAGGERGAGIVGQETWGDVAKFALDNPLDVLSFAGQVGIEQAPSLGAAIVGTAVTKNPRVGMGIMGGSTYAQERFGQMAEAAQKFGYDLTKPEDAKKAANDEAFLAEQESRGFKRGTVIAAIDAITLGLGSKLPLTKMGLAGNFGLQVGGGSWGEATGQLLTEGEITSPGDVFVEGLAEGVTLPLEVGIMVAGNRSGADVDTDTANALAQEEVALAAQAEQEAIDNQQRVGLARVQAAREFIPFKTFQSQKAQEQIAEVLNSETQAGQDFLNWVANTRTPERPYPQTDKEFQAEAKRYIKENTPAGASQELFEEYNALLDEHTEFKAEQAQRTPKAQEQADKLVTDLLQQRAEARAAGDADAEAKVEATAASMLTAGEWRFAKFKADGVIKDKALKKETPKKPVAPEAGEQPDVETNLMEDPEVQTNVGEGFGAQENVDETPEPPAAVDPMTIPVRRRTDALKQLDALVEDGSLPPNWVDENVDLNSAVNGQRFNIKKYKEALENTLNPVEETDVATEEDVEVEPVNAEEVTKIKGLSKSQQKVYDVLVDHFVGDKKFEIDEVYAGGQFQTTKIAELAGVESKQAVSTTINRFKTKFLEQQGNLEKGATKKQKDEAFAKFADALAAQPKQSDTDAQPEQVSDEFADAEDAVDQQPDADEVTDDDTASNSVFQQQGMGTVASVGQGAYTGVSPEDKEFTQARAEEKDQYENKRQELADRERRIQRVRLVKAYGQTAMNLWRNMATDGAVQPEQLSTEDLMDWIGSVQEFEEGAIDENTLSQDQREIEQRYENEATTETTEETDDAGQDTRAVESAEGGDTAEQVGATDTRPPQEKKKLKTVKNKPVVTSKVKFSLSDEFVNRNIGDLDAAVNTLEHTADQLFDLRAITPDPPNDPEGRKVKRNYGDYGANDPNSRVQIHKTPKDAVRQLGGSMTLEEVKNAKAFIDPRDGMVAHFIASNIAPSEVEGVILHEVGVHLGLEAQMKPEEISLLADTVRDWENAEAGSLENEVYRKAVARVAFARSTGMDASLADVELLGYAVEAAVEAGVRLDEDVTAKDATSNIRKWLSDVAKFFTMLKARWLGRAKRNETTLITDAEELVAIARGAGYMAMDFAIVEDGTVATDKREVMGFYAGEDRGRKLLEGSDLRKSFISFEPGDEIFYWGAKSKFGPYSGITTVADYMTGKDFEGQSGAVSMRLSVYSDELEETNGFMGRPITTVNLINAFDDIFTMTVYGPDDGSNTGIDPKNVTSTTDVEGQNWTRLEGVTHSQNMRLFTEARRRLTRYTGGVVPTIGFTRVTGAAASNVGPASSIATDGRNQIIRARDVRKRFSVSTVEEAEAAAKGTSVEGVKEATRWFIGKDAGWRVSVVNSPDDLIGLVLNKEVDIGGETLGTILDKGNAQGTVLTDREGITRAFFYADNIPPGSERAVVAHELGGHIGMDQVLTSQQITQASTKINNWANSEGTSLEKTISERALSRVRSAEAQGANTNTESETIAYFLEEAVKAGVTPNSDSKSDLVSFVRKLWADFKRALRKLRPANEASLSAQDLVSMARGAARLELTTDFHGSTKAFRSVQQDFLGLGNNAFGVGFYITEDQETGTEYMVRRMDEQRSIEGGALQRVDTTVAENEFVLWHEELSAQPNILSIVEKMPSAVKSALAKEMKLGGSRLVESMGSTFDGPIDLGVLTGRQLYLGLTSMHARSGDLENLVSAAARKQAKHLADYDADGYRSNIHRNKSSAMSVVSSYLDSLGVKGVKHVNAMANEIGTHNKIIFNADNAIVVGRNEAQDVDPTTTTPGTIRFSVPESETTNQTEWTRKNFGDGAAEALTNLGKVAKAPISATKNLDRIIRENEKKMPSARKWYDVMLRAQSTANDVLSMVEGVINQSRRINRERKVLVNDFIGSSTFFQKWGYDPQWTDPKTNQPIQVEIDPVMKQKYDRLNAEEQQLVRDVFAHGRKMQLMMREIADNLGVSKFFKLDSSLTGPYAPLKRFGKYVGELKSQELLNAEAALAAEQTATNRKKIEELKTNSDHYVISFFESQGAADTFVNANKDNYAYTEASEKAVTYDESRPGGAKAYEKILGAVNANLAGLDQSSKDAMAKMVRDMYFQTLDDSNARLSGTKRLNRAGYDKDMIRAFAEHGMSQANLVAQMKHGADISSALVNARKEAGKSSRELMPIYNQVALKFQRMMSPRSGMFADIESAVMKFNSFYMLTSSLGYYFQNLTQPYFAVANVAGEFGYTKQPAVWGKLLSGYNVARKVINTGFLNQVKNVASMGLLGGNSTVELNIDQAPPELRPVLQELAARGLLDVGVAEDLRHVNMSPNILARGYDEITHRLYQSARYVEATNRIASAVAAFRMAQRNPQKMRRLKMTPAEYAVQIVQDTQGNFSQMDAPAAFDVLPKAPLQFRKYQFQMAWLHIDAAKQALKGADPATRRAGFRKLSLMMGYTGVFGGLVSVPMANVATAIAQAVIGQLEGDDEENPPKSLERWIRENVEDERTATLLSRGVPAALGWDFSQKLDQADLFMPYNSKYVDFDPSRDGALLFAAQLALGPTGTQVGNVGNVADFINRGNYYRAAEYMMPKGLRSYLETLRFANEGYETRSGLTITDPTSFDVGDFLSNAVGLPSTEINQIKWKRGQQIEIEQWFSGETTRIKRQYLTAHENRNKADMKDLREQFRELQKAKDRVRPFFNNNRNVLKRSPLSDLLRHPLSKRREQLRLDRTTGR